MPQVKRRGGPPRAAKSDKPPMQEAESQQIELPCTPCPAQPDETPAPATAAAKEDMWFAKNRRTISRSRDRTNCVSNATRKIYGSSRRTTSKATSSAATARELQEPPEGSWLTVPALFQAA